MATCVSNLHEDPRPEAEWTIYFTFASMAGNSAVFCDDCNTTLTSGIIIPYITRRERTAES